MLGARLLVKCDFTDVAGASEKALVTVDDVETTERIPVPVQEITAPVSVDAVSDTVARAVADSIREHYPVQGRLQSGADGPEINIARPRVSCPDDFRYSDGPGNAAYHRGKGRGKRCAGKHQRESHR